jgi:hypothetical protein
MTSPTNNAPPEYLDPLELAQLTGESVWTVRLRTKHGPRLLPPRALLFDHELLRWRKDVVNLWMEANMPAARF